ncbi:hypothetical protein E3N88_18690 [Mikania micrantha]|uniref:Uncharacterized protein n=1 Tax=Mikania micrantha TaxID=192012 RepID=A0A5N6NLL4_9ASTR|nr:hypothetical protein E3N88_18690 [Mikania micrantha]
MRKGTFLEKEFLVRGRADNIVDMEVIPETQETQPEIQPPTFGAQLFDLLSPLSHPWSRRPSPPSPSYIAGPHQGFIGSMQAVPGGHAEGQEEPQQGCLVRSKVT